MSVPCLALRCGLTFLSPLAPFTVMGGILAIWRLPARNRVQYKLLKIKMIDHLNLWQRFLKPFQIKCPFVLWNRFYNIFMLILLCIKRTMLLHACIRIKGISRFTSNPSHYDSPTNMRKGWRYVALVQSNHEIFYYLSLFIRYTCIFVSSLKLFGTRRYTTK